MKPNKKTELLKIRVPVQMVTDLNTFAAQDAAGRSVSQVVRDAVSAYLASQKAAALQAMRESLTSR